jgi:hypothetical protein
MHGIEMGQHQDALAVALAHLRRRLALQDVAEAIAAGDTLELQPEVAELSLDMVDHLVDGLAVMAWALDRHPLDDAGEHLVGIDFRFVLHTLGGHRCSLSTTRKQSAENRTIGWRARPSRRLIARHTITA